MNITSIGNCYCNNLYAGQTTSPKAPSSGTVTESIESDKVTISQGAKLLNTVKFSEDVNGDGVITLDEIGASLEENLKKVRDILKQTLSALNISSSGRFQVDIDPYNKVIVTGGTNEENSAIAAVLQENDQFNNSWKHASNNAIMLAMAKPVSEFQKAYEADPKAAVTKYGWLFNKDWDFNMYFENDKIDYSVV